MLYGADWEFAGLAFSPDGRTIAYNSVEPGDRFRAQLVDVDGTNQRPIPPPVTHRPTLQPGVVGTSRPMAAGWRWSRGSGRSAAP